MERAGLRAGDRVRSFDGLPTRGTSDWDLLSIGLETNHPYRVDFERGGERHALTVTLDRRSFGRGPPHQRGVLGQVRCERRIALAGGVRRVQQAARYARACRRGHSGAGWPLGCRVDHGPGPHLAAAALRRRAARVVAGAGQWIPASDAGVLFLRDVSAPSVSRPPDLGARARADVSVRLSGLARVLPAWDLWAAAVVSYELLAGVHPFGAAVAGDYARAVISGTFTPLSAHVADAPPQWQAFFERALSPTVGLRPQSADTFISELELALT